MSVYLLIGVGDKTLMMMQLCQNAEIRRLLEELVTRQNESDELAAGKLPDSVQLPMTCQDDLHRLERQLVSQEIYRQLVIYNIL